MRIGALRRLYKQSVRQLVAGLTLPQFGCILATAIASFALTNAVAFGLPTEINAADEEFFEKKVRPLLVDKCLDCHSPDERGGGLSLGHRSSMQLGGDSGPAIDLESPEESLILKAIGYEEEFLKMPPDGKLSPEEVQVFQDWIKRGVPDPRPEEEISTPATGMSVEEGKKFWSMQPISNPPVPAIDGDDWSRNAIDRFIKQSLIAAELSPAPEADRATWLRRVYMDLIGLPPTYDEVQAFVNDSGEDAFERVVDRLLDSPQYGVRWGRHWLDTVRYADSNGLDENLAFGTAWRYRDYVVQSWNKNKPFNRFLQEQIAGDLLPDADLESHTGTGFLVLGAKVLAEPDKEKLFADTIDEQLDCFGKVFLGMTFGCVRCHDHKFDPILQTDYYSLAAIFKSTRTFGDTNTGAIKHWREISFATPDESAKMQAVNQELAAKNAAYNQARSKAINELRQVTRSKVLDYLVASLELPHESSFSDCVPVAEKHGLHPRVLLQCRTFLARFSDSLLFKFWNEQFESKDETKIREFYAKAFDPESDAPQDLKDAAAKALADNTGFLAIPAKIENALTPEQVEEIHHLANEARIFESSAPDDSTFMGVIDGEVVETTPVHIRGNHTSFGQHVPRNFPAVMVSHTGGDAQSSPVVFDRHQSGRLELVQWMTSPSHPLTARVFANRLWRWHFGAGIVQTTENFGVLGDRPSHPELLDFLARDLIASGWNVKEMQRAIVLSATYRMGSSNNLTEAQIEKDPENRLLWKFPLNRIDAEQIRDSIMYVAGNLDLSIGGKTVPLRNRQFVFDHTSIDHTKYDLYRRTAYFPIIRNNLAPLLRLYDYPDPTMPTGSRATTSVAPQSLLLMNAPWVLDASELAAKKILTENEGLQDRIAASFRVILSRLPNDREREVIVKFVSQEMAHTEGGSETPTEISIWARVLQNLVLGNEFFFVR